MYQNEFWTVAGKRRSKHSYYFDFRNYEFFNLEHVCEYGSCPQHELCVLTSADCREMAVLKKSILSVWHVVIHPYPLV